MEKYCIVFGLVLSVCVSGVRPESQCDPTRGPEGYMDCVKIGPHFDDHQWASCLSNDLIKLRSKSQHFCESGDARYCWYPCMLAVYGTNSGAVREKCKCDVQTTNRVQMSLGHNCYVPINAPKTGCEWYEDCLERTHVCESTPHKYALTYARHYCNRFEHYYDQFSDTGKKWVNAVRRCLQVKLLPFLYPGVSVTCQELKQAAFDSHTGCYLSPFEDAPSFCDLKTFKDRLLVFWTIKKSFTTDTKDSIKGVIATLKHCATLYATDIVRKILLFVSEIKQIVESKIEEFIELIADRVAEIQNWENSGYLWVSKLSSLGYPSESGYIVIEISIAPQTYVLNGNGQNTNLDSVATQLKTTLANGGLADITTQSGDVTSVLRLKNCQNDVCTSTDVDDSTDPLCQAKHGYCQQDNLPCSGTYHTGACAGPANRRCCVPVDTQCALQGGLCQFTTQECAGDYVSGLCHGPSYRKCCATSGCSTSVKDYACKIKDLYDNNLIDLWNRHPSGVIDNAYALNNIIDTCNGGRASRSAYGCNTAGTFCNAPGGSICLSAKILKYIYTLATNGTTGKLHVNEIAGACHSCTSRHYYGQAVDLHIIRDKTDSSREPKRKEYMETCTSLGGWALDETSHIHCQIVT